MSRWPFSDSKNTMAFTTRQVAHEGKPVLVVIHDKADGSWQFLTGGALTVADGMMDTLKNIVASDPSLLELADLPMGWRAIRVSKVQPWVRAHSDSETE